MDLTRIAMGLALGGLTGCYQGADVDGEVGEGTLDDGLDDSSDGDDDGVDLDACEPEPTISAPLRRLTASEYRNTVLDLLGVDASELIASFPTDPRIHGFDNNAAAQAIGLAHVSRYQAAAEWIAAEILDDPQPTLGCDPAQIACRDAFIDQRMPLLWRRPLTEPERIRLRELAESVPDGAPRSGLGLVIRAALQSPHLLFRPEPGMEDGERTGFEVATRLSYFLWRSAPGAQLHERVAAGELDSAQGVAEVARWMWSDPRAARGRAGLTEGWLRTERLETVVRDPQLYPEWSPELRTDLTQEVVAMVERFATGEDDFLEVLVSPDLTLGPRSAPLYDAPQTSETQEISFDDPWRGGVLSTAGVLALTSPGNVTSPVARGVWVRDAILCEPLPPPPSDVEIDPTTAQGEDKAAQLEAHRSDPSCAGCHSLVDPIGLGLERYDALGRLRVIDELGQPASTMGSVAGLEDSEFEGAQALGERLRQAPQTRTCLATQMLRWAHGRSETEADACVLASATEAFEAEGHLEDLAVAIATMTR